MFDKFGEFDSVEELNEAAAGFLREGDIESLKELAKENGIDEEDAEDYADGYTDCLATPMMAAVGRIEAERKAEKASTMSAIGVIMAMAQGMCTGEDIQKGIMKKGKRAAKLLDEMRTVAKDHKDGNVGVCCGTDKQLKDLIRAYYTQPEQSFRKKLRGLYEVEDE